MCEHYAVQCTYETNLYLGSLTQDHAYPADELMPLTCKGRIRGVDKGRGDIDFTLGRFSLTLIDTLDTLAVSLCTIIILYAGKLLAC